MAFSGISFMKFYNHILKFGMCVESAIRKQAVKTKIQLIQILQFPTDMTIGVSYFSACVVCCHTISGASFTNIV